MKSFQLWAIICCCLSIPRKCFSVLFPKSLLFNLTSKKASLKEKKLNFISTILPEISDNAHFCNFLSTSDACTNQYFCNFSLCQQKRNGSICFNQKCLQIIVNVFAVFCLCNKLPPHLVSLRISGTFGVSPSNSWQGRQQEADISPLQLDLYCLSLRPQSILEKCNSGT